MSATNIEVKLPEGVRPSVEANDLIIRKFLKACNKEGIMKEINEKNDGCRRFVKRSTAERLRKIKYRKTMRENEAKLKQHLDYLEHNKKRVR